MSALAIHAAVDTRGIALDLEVAEGQVVALLGSNGSGKSTAVGLAAGTLRPSSGEVTIDGRRVSGAPWVPPHLRHISLLAQEPLLLPHLDVLANVAFGPCARGTRRAAAREIARERLEQVGAGHLARRRPRELSGGQQQRVALARALAPSPRLLLLDEPLSALDVDAAAEMRQVLRYAVRDTRMSALVVTHDLLDVLALADAVVVLEDGWVAETGTTEEILARPRSRFGARFAGVNLVLGTRTGREEMREHGDGPLVHGVTSGEASSAPAGSRAAAMFAPRAVAVHREASGGSPRNTLPVTVTGIEQHGELVRVRGRTPAGTRLAADITPASLSRLGVAVGEDVLFVVKAAEVNIYAA